MITYIITVILALISLIWGWLYYTQIYNKTPNIIINKNDVLNLPQNLNNNIQKNNLEIITNIGQLKWNQWYKNMLKLLNSWNWVLINWNKLNSELFNIIQNIDNSSFVFNKEIQKKLERILSLYKKNTVLQQTFIKSELQKINFTPLIDDPVVEEPVVEEPVVEEPVVEEPVVEDSVVEDSIY